MIYNDLLVSITNSEGEALKEFKQSETGENSVDVPTPPRIRPIRNFKTGLGLYCTIKLDGQTVTSGNLKPSKISLGLPGIKTGMTVAEGLKRFYVFGHHNITDRDDLAQPDDPRQELMGTIQVTLSWAKYGKSRPRYEPYLTPKEPGFVHERTVKKGHSGAATLGAPVRKHSRGLICQREDAGLPKVVFLFRYGPRDWLEAKDIIVTERHPAVAQDFEPKTSAESVKKERETTVQSIPETVRSHSTINHQVRGGGQSDVIDVDELESDNDSDVVVLNDPIISEGSTNPVKAET